MFGRIPFGPARWALAGVPLFCLFLLAGCTEEYAADLTYGLRTDPVIVVPVGNANQPTRLDPPGEFNTLIDLFVADYRAKNGGSQTAIVSVDELTSKEFPKVREQLNRGLRLLFGTPARPKVEGLEPAVIKALRVDEDTLASGSRLYRRHCLHCHGLSGNGQGPTGPWVNPHPRDYRLGQFKFISTAQQGVDRKPRRDDLLRTLRQGVEGTSMPSFALLTDSELDDLVSYVIHLSIRGQTEVDVLKGLLVTQSIAADADVQDEMVQSVQAIASLWVEADKSVTKPEKEGVKPGDPAFAESVKRGQAKFLDACKGCHSEYGQKANLFWDNWGTVVKPANLTLGIYRGGRRPIDLYWRIHVGVPGSNMPANYPALNSDQIWDVVNFLQVLPYESEREKYGIELNQKVGAAAPGH